MGGRVEEVPCFYHRQHHEGAVRDCRCKWMKTNQLKTLNYSCVGLVRSPPLGDPRIFTGLDRVADVRHIRDHEDPRCQICLCLCQVVADALHILYR